LRRYAKERGGTRPSPRVNIPGVVGSMICMAAYVAVLDTLGFLLAGMLYLFAQFTVLAPGGGDKNRFRIALLSLCAPVLIYGLFSYGFDMVLPACRLF
jgi:hypothetical protein